MTASLKQKFVKFILDFPKINSTLQSFYILKNEFELLDIVITYRKNGSILTEFDTIYINQKYKSLLS